MLVLAALAAWVAVAEACAEEVRVAEPDRIDTCSPLLRMQVPAGRMPSHRMCTVADDNHTGNSHRTLAVRMVRHICTCSLDT